MLLTQVRKFRPLQSCFGCLENRESGIWSADELAGLMEAVGLPQVSISGMFLNPVTNRWSLMNDTSVNYISYFRKKSAVHS